MKSVLAGVVLACCGLARAADPVVKDVTFAQDANNRIVTVQYTLENGPAYVAAEIVVDGKVVSQIMESAWGGALSTTDGLEVPLNCLVVSGTHSFQWRIDADAPGLSDPAASLTIHAWAPSAAPEYLLISLCETNNVHYYASTNNLPFGSCVTNEIYQTDYLLMRRIPARGARWRMGMASDNPFYQSAHAGHDTYHYVNMTNDYYIGVFELTQRQYWRVMGTEVGNYTDETAYPGHWRYPAVGVSSSLARGDVINRFTNLTGLSMILPTEEQWEFACRAGTGAAYSDGTDKIDAERIMAQCWYNGNSKVGGFFQPHVVGTKLPNSFGLYDMHGNAAEWTSSVYGSSDGSEVTEPVRRTGTKYVQRSGCFSYGNTSTTSSAARNDLPAAEIGLRLLVPAPPVAFTPPEKVDVSAWPFWGCDDAVTNRTASATGTASTAVASLDLPFEFLLENQNLGILKPGFLLLFR